MTRRPNILFLFPDQQRKDWLGHNQDLDIDTPNLDRLCETGVRFRQTMTSSPVCAPARACLASGKRYETCGVRSNGQPYPLDQPTFYQSLRDAGYRVGGCGKFDLDKPNLEWNLDGSRLIKEWGFTDGVDNEGKLDGSRSYKSDDIPKGPYMKALVDAGFAEAYCAEHGKMRECLQAYTTLLPDELYCDNWLSEIGLAQLRRFPADTPWFMQVNFTGPHNPMDVTASMRESCKHKQLPQAHKGDAAPEDMLRNRQNYVAMIENIDRQIGRFIDEVHSRGELDNTLIVYSSDHGEMLGDHGMWGKSTWRASSVDVPLIVSGPGLQENAVSDALVVLHDLTATFLDAAGLPQLPGSDAKSLMPILRAEETSHRDVICSALDYWALVYDGTFKLVQHEGEKPMLFDCVNDPFEDHDIADKHPGKVAQLSPYLTCQASV
jgi:arylsulfatase A-like enzyme